MTIIWKRVLASLREAAARGCVLVETNLMTILLVVGAVLLTCGVSQFATAQGMGPLGSYSEASFDDELIRNSVGNLFKLIEGAFGALVMVVAGLFAIIAAAMGQYRTALGMLVVAVGAFILRALVSLFFGSDFSDFEV